jgi:Transposase
MRAVADHGTPLVEDPGRLEGVAALGVDETSFLKATRLAPTRWITGLVDLEGGRLLDLVADRTRAAVDGWLSIRPRDWLAHIATVALDPWRSYASALAAPLGHATVVVDHFHAIRLANTVVDQVRRRVQQATLGHRGRRHDPLYRIRKLLLTAQEQRTQRGAGGTQQAGPARFLLWGEAGDELACRVGCLGLGEHREELGARRCQPEVVTQEQTPASGASLWSKEVGVTRASVRVAPHRGSAGTKSRSAGSPGQGC